MINKTVKGISALALALMMLFGSAAICFAAGSQTTEQYSYNDSANVFTDQDINTLVDKLLEGNSKTGWQFIVMTDPNAVNYDDSLQDYYRDNYYKNKGFKENAVVLVYNTGLNKGTFFGTGEAKYYFTDSRIDETGKMLRKNMDAQTYLDGAAAFVDKVEKYYSEGSPELEKRDNKLGYVLKHYWWIFALIGLVAAGATFGITAGRYKYNGKFNTYDLKANSNTMLTEEHDVFVTKHTTSRIIRSESSDSSSSSSSSGGDF